MFSMELVFVLVVHQVAVVVGNGAFGSLARAWQIGRHNASTLGSSRNRRGQTHMFFSAYLPSNLQFWRVRGQVPGHLTNAAL